MFTLYMISKQEVKKMYNLYEIEETRPGCLEETAQAIV